MTENVENHKPVNLGKVDVNLKEESVISLHPNFALYRKVSVTDVEIGIEESYAKLRLDMLNQNKDESNSNVHSDETCVLSLNNMRATDMKSNKRVFFIPP